MALVAEIETKIDVQFHGVAINPAHNLRVVVVGHTATYPFLRNRSKTTGNMS